MCNRISVPLQSSPCKIHVILQSRPYKSFAGPDQKQMEFPAQICQTPRDRHAACNAEGGQKSLLPKVLCRPQIAGDHRIHAVVKRAAGDEGNGRRDEKRRRRRIAAPGKDLGIEGGTKTGQQICKKDAAQCMIGQQVGQPRQKPAHSGGRQVAPVQVEDQPKADRAQSCAEQLR